MTDTKFGGNPHLLPPIPIKHMTRHAPAVKAIVNQSPKVSFWGIYYGSGKKPRPFWDVFFFLAKSSAIMRLASRKGGCKTI